MVKQKLIAKQIEKIIVLLDELQYRETDLFISIQKNQATILSKIDKLQEYNEIDDMNNCISETRPCFPCYGQG